ncbi:hypothetical protein F5X96DRAFT_643343, partial [Biscogniauxia mediterranea]
MVLAFAIHCRLGAFIACLLLTLDIPICLLKSQFLVLCEGLGTLIGHIGDPESPSQDRPQDWEALLHGGGEAATVYGTH